jgi:hypothetical protein
MEPVMKKPIRIAVALVLVILASAGCSTSKRSAAAPAAESESTSLGLPKPSGPVPDDVARARAEWAQKDDFGECEDQRPLEEMLEAFGASNWKRMLEIAEPWKKRSPVDIDASFALSIALKELGRTEEAKEAHRWTVGLVDSVLSSGDGRTSKNAYFVLSVPEEYSMLRLFGFKSEGQALVEDNIDVLFVADEDGRKTSIFFNPEPHFRRLAKRFP